MAGKGKGTPKQPTSVRNFGSVGTYIEKVDTIERLSNSPEGKRLDSIGARIDELARAVRSDDRLSDKADAIVEQLTLASSALARQDLRACESTLQRMATLLGDERGVGEAIEAVMAELPAPQGKHRSVRRPAE